MKAKLYRIWKQGKFINSRIPGRFAIIASKKIFGRLDCPSGKRLVHPKNRIFVHTYEDAIAYGARPCKKCNPKPEDIYYQCGNCGEFISTDVLSITTCTCKNLTIDPLGCGLVQISGHPHAHKRIGPKKRQTPA
ncbi:MAG: Ada metal-binding domain-containing protein [Candidatus Paceibacterota bacterium]|jgi:hypothetical protein